MKLSKRLYYGINYRCGRVKGYEEIKCLITFDEFLQIMKRDHFWKMYDEGKHPNIHRLGIEAPNHYKFWNCKFISAEHHKRCHSETKKNGSIIGNLIWVDEKKEEH